MADNTAQTALVFDASGAQKGAADFKAAADKVIGSNRAVEDAADKAATTVGKSTERIATSLSSQTKMLDAMARSFDPLGSKAETASSKLEKLLKIVAQGGPNAARAASQVGEATDRLLASQQAAAAGTANQASELARLTARFDPATASARAMTGELRDLNSAQKLGIVTGENYRAAWQGIVNSYDEGAIAAKRAAAAQAELIASARAAQNATNSQANINSLTGVQTSPGSIGGRTVTGSSSASDSAAVFEKQFAAEEKLLAERKALETELNPLKTRSLEYAAALDRVTRAVDLGVISQKQAQIQTARITDEFAAANAPLGNLNNKLNEHAKVSGNAAFAQRQLGVQSVQFFSSVQGGQPILTALIQQGHQLLDVALSTGTGFGVLGQGIKTAFSYLVSPVGLIVAAGAALIGMGVAAEVSARRLGTLRNQLGAVREDAAGAVKMADDAARHLAATTSLGTGEARSAGATVLSAREFQGTQAQLEALITTAQKLSLRLGEDLPESAARMKKGLMDPAAFAQEMADKQLVGLDQALANAVKRLQQAGDKAGAFDLVLQALQKNVATATDNITPLQKALHELGEAFTGATSGGVSLATSMGTAITDAAASVISGIAGIVAAIGKLRALAPSLPEGTPGPMDSIMNSLKWYMPGYAGSRLINAISGPGSTAAPSAMGPVLNNDDAVGMFQLRRPAAADVGLSPDQRSDYGSNIRGGLTYFRQQLEGSGGNLNDATRAYNQGLAGAQAGKGGDYLASVQKQNLANLPAQTKADIEQAFGTIFSDYARTLAGPAIRDRIMQIALQESGGQHYDGRAAGASPTGVAPSLGGASPSSIPGAVPKSGAVNVDTVDDATKLANGMNLVSPAAEKARGELEKLQTALAELKAKNQEGTPQFALLTEAVRHAQLEIQNTIEPADKLTQSLDRQTAGEIRIAAAYGQGYGAVAQATAAVKAEEEARNQAAVGTQEYIDLVGKLTAKYLAQADAEQRTVLGKQVQEMDLQVQAQNELAEAYGKGEAAVVRVTAQTKAEGEARALALAGLADYDTALATLTNGYVAVADAQARVGLRQQMLANDNQMVMIRGEGDALGMNNDQRTIYLAKLRAELDLKQRGLPINDDFAKGYIANAEGISKATLNLANQKQALSDIAGAFSQSFDTIGNAITQSLLSGQGAAVNWKNIMTSVAQQVLQQFMKLAVLNPLLNSLFPGSEHRSTWGDVIGAMGKQSTSSIIPGSTTTTDSSGGTFGAVLGMVGKVAGLFGGGGGMASGAELAGLTNQAAVNVSLGAAGMHRGGLVGIDPPSFTRMLDRSIIDQAPRFHRGLGANEFAAILERGERVLTGRQQQQMAAAANSNVGGGASPSITFNFPPNTQPDSFRRAGQQVAAHVQGALARAKVRNG